MSVQSCLGLLAALEQNAEHAANARYFVVLCVGIALAMGYASELRAGRGVGMLTSQPRGTSPTVIVFTRVGMCPLGCVHRLLNHTMTLPARQYRLHVYGWTRVKVAQIMLTWCHSRGPISLLVASNNRGLRGKFLPPWWWDARRGTGFTVPPRPAMRFSRRQGALYSDALNVRLSFT